jgi:hypothetical protein
MGIEPTTTRTTTEGSTTELQPPLTYDALFAPKNRTPSSLYVILISVFTQCSKNDICILYML